MELERVMQEIDMLRKELTPEEKSKLDFSTFDAESPESCIYGQATGSCHSERAAELVLKTGLVRNKQCISALESYLFDENLKIHQNNERIISYIKGEIDELTLTNY